jgi:hypothetical protein
MRRTRAEHPAPDVAAAAACWRCGGQQIRTWADWCPPSGSQNAEFGLEHSGRSCTTGCSVSQERRAATRATFRPSRSHTRGMTRSEKSSSTCWKVFAPTRPWVHARRSGSTLPVRNNLARSPFRSAERFPASSPLSIVVAASYECWAASKYVQDAVALGQALPDQRVREEPAILSVAGERDGFSRRLERLPGMTPGVGAVADVLLEFRVVGHGTASA